MHATENRARKYCIAEVQLPTKQDAAGKNLPVRLEKDDGMAVNKFRDSCIVGTRVKTTKGNS